MALLAWTSGCSGERGPEGEAGPPGVRGEPGEDGEAGPPGEMGEPGEDGDDGNGGVDGMNGRTGADGRDGDDGDDGDDGTNGAPGFARASFLVSSNPATAPRVARVSESYGSYFDLVSGGNEGLAFDAAGRLYQASDVNAPTDPGSIRVIAGYDESTTSADRVIGGAGSTATGLVSPKGIAIANEAGVILVANNGATQIAVFGLSAAGDAAPIATTTLSANPWDLFYDEAADRLFVTLVNGELAVFDDYVADDFGDSGVARTIVPSDAGGAKTSTNLHGIDYDRASDRIVVTDVGATNAAGGAGFASDGSIYVIDEASTASGNVAPSRVIEGMLSGLGNPVDAILDGADLRVAEKANDRLLVFRGVLEGASGDLAPDLAIAFTKPESIAAEPSRGEIVDVSDLDDAAYGVRGLAVVSNPAGAATSRVINRVSRGLTGTTAAFTFGDEAIESITVDANGDAWATFDDGDTATVGGVAIVGGFARGRGGDTFTASRDRTIEGAATLLVSPKGIDVADDVGLAFIAENNATTPAILAFGTAAAGNAAPAFFTSLIGIGRPWDVDYDPIADRLFVALTNGTVMVYDDYVLTEGEGSATRTFTPAVSGVDVSDNMHGIVYVEAYDALLLSDVGAVTTGAVQADDGELFLVDAASSASGLVDVTIRVPSTASAPLANPVDIAFDGRNLYVAEKLRDTVYLYTDIFYNDGADPIALTYTRPESLAVIPGFLR